MLKKLITAAILSAYLYGINISLVCLAEYSLEYNYIVKNLCVKKDIPDNDCCGKCFLKKNLDKTSGEKKENSSRITENSFTIHLAAEPVVIDEILKASRRKIPSSDRILFSRTILPEKLPPRSFLILS